MCFFIEEIAMLFETSGIADSNFFKTRLIFQKYYPKQLEPVCEKHSLTRVEMDILLFLANNPEFDTAKDIVEFRGIAKSYVSAGISSLEERGYIERNFKDGNRKTIHLTLTKYASDAIRDGREVQKQFFGKLKNGITEEEMKAIQSVLKKVLENIENVQKN